MTDRREACRAAFRALTSSFEGEIRFDEPLSRHTFYRIGGPAAVLAIPRSLSDLGLISRLVRDGGIPLFVLGSGTNLLVADAGFEGVVVKASRINPEIEEIGGEGTPALRTGGSVSVPALLNRAAVMGWDGLEFLAGIPGSVGGAVVMNAGTHLGESSGSLLSVEYVPLLGASSGGPVRLEAGELRYTYRSHHFLPAGAVVWAAEWRIRRDEPARVRARIDDVLKRRKATQPLELPSCGSVFKNPAGELKAWQVIERLGLRGRREGGAQFSEKHANFIVNHGGAKAEDVRALIRTAKERARAELSIELEEEVKYLGFSGS